MKDSLRYSKHSILQWTPYSLILLISCFISAHDTAIIRIVPGSVVSNSLSTKNRWGVRDWLNPKNHRKFVLTSEINSTCSGIHSLMSSNLQEESSPFMNGYISAGIRYPPRGGGVITLASSIISKNKTSMTTRQKDILKCVSFLSHNR